MTIVDFYKDFEYIELVDVKKHQRNLNLDEFRKLGIDKVYFSGDFPAIFFKEVNQFDRKTLKNIARIHHLAWNYRKVMFLFVLSTTEIRIYDCCKKPFNYENSNLDIVQETRELELIGGSFSDIQTFETIKQLFSRVSVDCGLLWISDNKIKDRIDNQQRIDRYLVKSLLNAAKQLSNLDLRDDIIHSLLMRSIFIMYLEDKGAAKETRLYSEIIDGAESYLDILEYKMSAYALFDKLQAHFKGNVFSILPNEELKVTEHHLRIIKNCLIDGDLSGNPKLFNWRIFRFDIIQIELLSEIYENFLEEFKEKTKEETGQYYTPPSLVELILNEKLQVNGNKNWQYKILDPACGSGIFLVESYKRLVKRWQNAHPGQTIQFKDLRQILKDNIFGIEYDKLAIRVTAFSLYLAIVEHLNPKTLWIDKRYKFPHLINDLEDQSIEIQGNNLFRADTIGDIKSSDFHDIDFVVGNPPFGSKIKLKSIRDYCDKYNYGKDMVIPFLRKAVELAPEGCIALIFNTKVLTNTEGTFQNFRRWLFNETYVEKIYNLSIFRKAPKTFGGQLFSSAVGPVSIIFYQKSIPTEESSTIEYWAPKTYVKNNLVDGVIIDSTDIKFIPRLECKKPETKIWKIAMWGSQEDFQLIENILNRFPRLNTILDKYQLVSGIGLHKKDKADEFTIAKGEIVPTNSFDRFFLHYTQTIKVNQEFRPFDKKLYKAPFITIKESIKSDQRVCSTFFDFDSFYLQAIYGLYSKNKDINILKALTAFYNSDYATYFLFLTSSTWGIERDRVKLNEVMSIGINEDVLSSRSLELSRVMDNAQEEFLQWYPLKVSLSNFERQLNTLIEEIMRLSYREKILIEDLLLYSIDLFYNGHKSKSLLPVSINEVQDYVSIIMSEIEDFLDKEIPLSCKIYDVNRFQPLNVVIFEFFGERGNIEILDSDHIKDTLNIIDTFLLSKKAKSIYIKKQVKYFDNNRIMIVKPNQKRLWSRSVALNDSKELINEILKMETIDER